MKCLKIGLKDSRLFQGGYAQFAPLSFMLPLSLSVVGEGCSVQQSVGELEIQKTIKKRGLSRPVSVAIAIRNFISRRVASKKSAEIPVPRFVVPSFLPEKNLLEHCRDFSGDFLWAKHFFRDGEKYPEIEIHRNLVFAKDAIRSIRSRKAVTGRHVLDIVGGKYKP